MEDDENAKVCKVVLLGESGVGKTCIIERFVDDIFEEGKILTSIASFRSKIMTFEKFQGKSIKFEVWDTAGQEKYRALNRIFYKDAGAAILVYDITTKESFEQIKKFWYNQVKEFAPKNISKKILYNYCFFILLVIGIAGNKSDLFDQEQVDEEEAKNYATEVGAIFRLTSACTSLGIEELFKSIGSKLLDPNYKDDEDDNNNEKNKGTNNKGVKLDKAKNNAKKKKACC